MILPNNQNLRIDKLTSVFNDVTNSYKFFWFLAIIECIKEGKNKEIMLETLIIKMLSMAWFPINFYRLSFGKQDQFTKKIQILQQVYNFPQNIDRKVLENQIIALKTEKEIQDILKFIAKYVPFRFIRPFFSEQTKGVADNEVNNLIVFCANATKENIQESSIYYFLDNQKSIIINSFWLSYLETHLYILESFCKYHLILYLQKNNPNTPSVAEKLENVNVRDLKNGKLFWKTYLNTQANFSCIYSKQIVTTQNISIDHFLPFSFVAHDQLWNLVPTTKSVNSSKSDKIPLLSQYFNPFAKVQFQAFKVNFEAKNMKILEDYSNLFNEELDNIYQKNETDFLQTIENTIFPLVQIASNMGFPKNWIY